ncbi:hypothetical protein HOE91_05795 [archaeon]|jgi:hypothetical protein|nr:hypothetical protein [archaeon]
MAYKRYFYRNGKKFGPYYYESYRDEDGKVKKKYIGTTNPDKAFQKSFKQKSWFKKGLAQNQNSDKNGITPTRKDKLTLIFLFAVLFLIDIMVLFWVI